MNAGHLPERDGADVEALIADQYLEALMSAADRHADDAPADAALDPDVRDAARLLRRALIRVHPSFRFEERLASRLADLAAAQGRPLAAAGGEIVPFAPAPGAARRDADPFGDPLLAPILAGTLDPADGALDPGDRPTGIRRPLIVRGAITSAAISLVGVAWVAWRTARPGARSPASAMARAAQAAHARRLAAESLAAAGGLSGSGGPA